MATQFTSSSSGSSSMPIPLAAIGMGLGALKSLGGFLGGKKKDNQEAKDRAAQLKLQQQQLGLQRDEFTQRQGMDRYTVGEQRTESANTRSNSNALTTARRQMLAKILGGAGMSGDYYDTLGRGESVLPPSRGGGGELPPPPMPPEPVSQGPLRSRPYIALGGRPRVPTGRY